MPIFKKIRISYFFTGILISVIVILATILAAVFVESLDDLGKFTNDQNADNIRTQTKNFVRKGVELETWGYSALFNRAERLSQLFARHIEAELLMYSNNPTMAEEELKTVNLKSYNNQIYYNYSEYKDKAFFIPKPMPDGISKKQEFELSVLSKQAKYILTAVNHSKFINDIWIMTGDYVTCIYPNVSGKYDVKSWKIAKQIIDEYVSYIGSNNVERGKSLWSKIHKSYSGELQISVLSPIFDINNNFAGMVGVSVLLEKVLIDILGEKNLSDVFSKDDNIYKEFPGTFTFIINESGEFIAFPIKKYSLFSLPPEKLNKLSKLLYEGNIKESNDKNIQKLADLMINFSEGETSVSLDNKKYIVVFRNLLNSRWTLGVVIPEFDLFNSIRETKTIEDKARDKIIINVFVVTIILILLFVISELLLFRKFLIKPIVTLCNKTEGIVKGNFEFELMEMNSFELNRLSKALYEMCRKLLMYIRRLKLEFEKRQEIESEIQIAAEIQRSLLPKIKSFLRPQFDLYADLYLTETASKCFYDVYFIDNDTLILAIADISERGVPAAFFMGMFKTLLKNTCLRKKNDIPGKTLDEVNQMVIGCDFGLNMHVSLFLGYYKYKSGKLYYSNTGSSVGVYLVSGKEGISRLAETGSAVIGGASDTAYKTEEVQIDNDDKLVLYARELDESITEDELIIARNNFVNIILKNKHLSCEDLCKEIKIAADNNVIGDELESAALFILERK